MGYLLAEKNVDFEILEKEGDCGGLMRTLEEKGYTFDRSGSHIIFSKNREILKFMLSLLGRNRIRRRRETKVLYKNQFVKYPFENGMADLPRIENFECLYYFVQNLIRKEKGELKKPDNLKEWFYYIFGKGIAEKYLVPYNEKIWKYPTEKIGLEWVGRIPNPPIKDLLKSSLGISTEGYTHQLYFYYPRVHGIQAIIDSLKRRVSNRIITDFEVGKIMKEDGKWIISNEKEERFYDRIISTVPVRDLVEATDAPKEVKSAAANLRYNSLICVMLGLNKRKSNDLSWMYIPDKNSLPHRISFPSNYSPYAAPKRKSSVTAEVTCNIGSKTWRTNNEKIIERVIDDLDNLGIIHRNDVCFAQARRTEHAYAINDLDYSKNIKAVKKHVTGIGIHPIGRFAEFKYLNMDDCIKRAMTFAGCFS